jgi:hypothetical protein
MTAKDAVTLYEDAGYIVYHDVAAKEYELTHSSGSQIRVSAGKLRIMANQAAKARRDLLPMTLEVPA